MSLNRAQSIEGAYQLMGYLTLSEVEYKLHSDPLHPIIQLRRNRTDESRWNVEDWGGYQTEWEIENDQLFLVEVFGFELSTGRQLSLNWLFPDLAQGAVHATWFSGELVCPYGRELRPTEGPGSYSEFLLTLAVECGRVIERRTTTSPSYRTVPVD